MADQSLIHELLAAQLEYNEWLRNATPEERGKAAIAQLRHIASVEPDSYGYLFDETEEKRG